MLDRLFPRRSIESEARGAAAFDNRGQLEEVCRRERSTRAPDEPPVTISCMPPNGLVLLRSFLAISLSLSSSSASTIDTARVSRVHRDERTFVNDEDERAGPATKGFLVLAANEGDQTVDIADSEAKASP